MGGATEPIPLRLENTALRSWGLSWTQKVGHGLDSENDFHVKQKLFRICGDFLNQSSEVKRLEGNNQEVQL